MKWQETPKIRMLPLAMIGLMLAGRGEATETPEQRRERELLDPPVRSEAPAVVDVQAADPAATVAQASPPSAPAPAPSSKSSASTPRSGPGSFEVDEEAAQRALERTLTQAGALLLPSRTVEVTPSFTYRRAEMTTAVPATITTAGASTPTLVLANRRTRRNENTARVDVRVGMPFNTQMELGLPYNHVRSSQVSDLGTATSANGSGVGDVTLGVAKTLTRESRWRPDVIGRLTYNFGNARRQDGNVPLLGGYRQVQAELVAIKRQDPLAFIAGTFYSRVFEEDSIKPGDAAGLSVAAVLAASPATSLQFGFSQIYRQKQELNGVKRAGSDQTYGVINLGASSVLSRDLTLVTQVGIGVGNDAPEYTFTVSLPILFR